MVANYAQKFPLNITKEIYYNYVIGGKNMRKTNLTSRQILEKELKGCYNFFIKEANNNKRSKGYGLIRDKDKLPIRLQVLHL